MNTRWMIRCVAAVLVLGLVTAAGWSVEGEEGKGPRDRQGPTPGERLERLSKALDLTAEQQTQIQPILQAHHQAMQNDRNANEQKREDLHKQIRDAAQAGERDKAKELIQQLEALNADRRAEMENFEKQLDEVLTDEQMEKAKGLFRQRARDMRPGQGPGRMAEALGLSDEQQEQVRTIMQAARAEAAQADTPEAKREILKAAMDKVHAEVLTEEQRAKAKELRANRPQREGEGRQRGDGEGRGDRRQRGDGEGRRGDGEGRRGNRERGGEGGQE